MTVSVLPPRKIQMYFNHVLPRRMIFQGGDFSVFIGSSGHGFLGETFLIVNSDDVYFKPHHLMKPFFSRKNTASAEMLLLPVHTSS
jgi:hypothetical protein